MTLNKQEIIKKYAEINLLSKKQTKRLLSLNIDIDFINDEIEERLLSPDIKHLQKVFLPKDKKGRKLIRKDFDIDQLLFAVAAGDIIGSKLEFTEHDYDDVDNLKLVSSALNFTDDTVLSYATRDAVIKNPKKPDFRINYLESYKKYPDAGYGYNFVSWATGEIDNTKGYGSFADGSAMRVAYIGAYYDDVKDVIKHAINSSLVTHSHQDGIKGAVVIAVIIWMLKHGYSKEDIYDYAKKFYSFTENEKSYLAHSNKYFYIVTDLSEVSNNISKMSMYANYAVPFAIKCFLETNSYEECMREVLRHFCDTDTICAISGGLAYTFYDNINLPEEDIGVLKSKLSSFDNS
jgi:ADP-ribosylglycohydrolase